MVNGRGGMSVGAEGRVVTRSFPTEGVIVVRPAYDVGSSRGCRGEVVAVFMFRKAGRWGGIEDYDVDT